MNIPNKSENLVEFVGIMLGDGSLYSQQSTRNYQIRITLNLEKEYEYSIFVKELIFKLFNLKFYEKIIRKENAVHICKGSKKLLVFLSNLGINKNKKIPLWIFKNSKFMKSCIRGLIDTDGSVFRMSRRDFRLVRISFKNLNSKLLSDVRRAFVLLGYHPSKIICDREIFLSRQDEVKRYFEEIGFNNSKHVKRIMKLAPWCSGQARKI